MWAAYLRPLQRHSARLHSCGRKGTTIKKLYSRNSLKSFIRLGDLEAALKSVDENNKRADELFNGVKPLKKKVSAVFDQEVLTQTLSKSTNELRKEVPLYTACLLGS